MSPQDLAALVIGIVMIGAATLAYLAWSSEDRKKGK